MGPPPPTLPLPPGDDLGEYMALGDMCSVPYLPCLFVLEWWWMCGDSWIDDPDPEDVDEEDGETEAGEMVGVIVVLK